MTGSTLGLPSGLAVRIISVLLAIAFLLVGGSKLASVPELVASFEAFGLPTGSHYIVGALEVLGAIGLFVRPFAKYAAILLVVISIGAFGMHVIYPPIQQGVPALVLLVLSAFVAYRYSKSNSAV
ncbi:MAG: DoxX family protein [Pseudomonadota bacterium]